MFRLLCWPTFSQLSPLLLSPSCPLRTVAPASALPVRFFPALAPTPPGPVPLNNFLPPLTPLHIARSLRAILHSLSCTSTPHLLYTTLLIIVILYGSHSLPMLSCPTICCAHLLSPPLVSSLLGFGDFCARNSAQAAFPLQWVSSLLWSPLQPDPRPR